LHRTPRFLLAVLAVLALALSSCGDNGIAAKSATDVLAETFGPDKPVDSGKVDFRVAFDGKGLRGLAGPLKLTLKGPFASAGRQKLPRFDFDLLVDVAGQALTTGAVSTGDSGWLKLAGENFVLGDKSFAQLRTRYEQDQKRAATSSNPTFQALGVDPKRWPASPKKAGAETVGGAETVHVTAKVDVPALLEDVNKLLGRADATGAVAAAGAAGKVPSKLTGEQRAQIAKSIKSTRLDVYSGKDDGILRRLTIRVTFDVPADVREAAGGLTTGRLDLDLVMSELNEKQRIAVPRLSRPLSDLTQAGATGATGASPDAEAAETPPAAVPAAPQADPNSVDGAYRACLDAAGTSIAEAQKCAPLLNGG
jgi:hypothetical protein